MIKVVKDDKYIIIFNTETGQEILTGTGGNPDPFVLEYPSLIDCGIMGHCLNDCPTCYQGNNTQSHMSLENFKLIVDQSKNYTNQIAVGGHGDPNLHPQFKEMIEYAKLNTVEWKNNSIIIINYTTSGNNLSDDQVEISKMCGAVAVSDYDQPFTYSAINRFLNAGIKTNIHFIFSSERFERAIDILDGKDVWNNQFDVSKLNAVIFLLFKPKGKGKGRYDLVPNPDQIKQFIDKIRKPTVPFKLGMDSCLVNQLATYDTLTKSEEIFLDTCEASRASMYITPDMRMVPCSFADYDKNGVKITPENTIKNIWDNSDSFNNCRHSLFECPIECPYAGE